MKLYVPDVDMSEREFTQLLFSRSRSKPGLAVTLGWHLCYHTFRSQKSPTGFPDWVLVRDRIVFAETKTEKGKPTPDQQAWLDGVRGAGGESYLWRPSDLEDIARILQHRGPVPAPCQCGRVYVHKADCAARLEDAA